MIIPINGSVILAWKKVWHTCCSTNWKCPSLEFISLSLWQCIITIIIIAVAVWEIIFLHDELELHQRSILNMLLSLTLSPTSATSSAITDTLVKFSCCIRASTIFSNCWTILQEECHATADSHVTWVLFSLTDCSLDPPHLQASSQHYQQWILYCSQSACIIIIYIISFVDPFSE